MGDSFLLCYTSVANEMRMNILFFLPIVPGECHQKEASSPQQLTEFQLEHLSSQQTRYDADTYNIDWEEVKAGRAAGMPGGWVS